MRHVVHTFPPVVDADCRVLILGSVPSVRSCMADFYYMHPYNRFWPLLSRLLGCDFVHTDKEGKRALLLQHHVALYDSVQECDILGSSDAAISNVIPADIDGLLAGSCITHIFCNGAASYRLLMHSHPHLRPITVSLPSTSPANAAWSIDRLATAWQVLTAAI